MSSNEVGVPFEFSGVKFDGRWHLKFNLLGDLFCDSFLLFAKLRINYRPI